MCNFPSTNYLIDKKHRYYFYNEGGGAWETWDKGWLIRCEGGELGSDPDPLKIFRILQNDADPSKPDPETQYSI